MESFPFFTLSPCPDFFFSLAVASPYLSGAGKSVEVVERDTAPGELENK